MSSSLLDTAGGLFCRITNAGFGIGKTSPCGLGLNEVR